MGRLYWDVLGVLFRVFGFPPPSRNTLTSLFVASNAAEQFCNFTRAIINSHRNFATKLSSNFFSHDIIALTFYFIYFFHF